MTIKLQSILSVLRVCGEQGRWWMVPRWWVGLLVFNLGAVVAVPASPLTDVQRRAVDAIAHDMLSSRYVNALRMADSVMATDGADPIFPMLKLMTVGVREMDFETVIDSGEFEQTADNVLQTLDSLQKHESRAAYAKTIRGFVLATRASYDLRRNHYVDAVRRGLKALEMLEEAARSDSSLADPDYFLGLYDWSKSDLRRRIWWVLFWLPGDRERGIRRLERCRREALFSRTAAALSLVEIYARSGKFERAQTLLAQLSVRFPQSRFLWWSEVRYHEERGKPRAAARVYALLADSYARERYGAYNAAFCGLQAANLFSESGDSTATAEACRTLLGFKNPRGDSRVAAIRDDAQRLLERTKKHDTGGS